ncbi:hypothetical protein VTO42DRAFT_6373 [Malbranchea cinnamomea]
MSTTQSQQVSIQEERLLLAIEALKKGEISSVRAAAKLYNVPHSTLNHRVKGRTARVNTPPKNRKLSLTEEECLIQWILAMDERGQPPRVGIVREMANVLLANRGSNPRPTVGQNWVGNFVNRHEELKSKFSRKRAHCEDPEVIRGWFKLVQNTIAKYGILPDDIYNFDEIGFQMGVMATARVATGSEKARNPKIIQPGDREWVTVIAGVNAMGWPLRPMIILKGTMHEACWYETEGLPGDWVIGISENGWTNHRLGLYWLKEMFNKDTLPRTKGKYRLLILDWHRSHVSAEFDQFCSENHIIALYMPPHSSHLLQPLDVGCFSPMKAVYGRQVENQMRLGINHIDQEEFLALYPAVHFQALNENNIKSGFQAAGLVPYDPEQALSRHNTRMHTSNPPGTSHSSQASWATATPHDVRQLELQSEKVKKYLQRCTQSPSSPTIRALDQLVKGCRMAMHNAAILAAHIRKLRAENEKRKRKRETRHQEGDLTVEEGIHHVRRLNEGETGVVEQPEEPPQKRVARQCSICGALEHTARTCSQRTGNNP